MRNLPDQIPTSYATTGRPEMGCRRGSGEQYQAMSQKYIDIVFDSPPAPDSGRFVEVENEQRQSINLSQWVHRDDGFWALRISQSDIETRHASD